MEPQEDNIFCFQVLNDSLLQYESNRAENNIKTNKDVQIINTENKQLNTFSFQRDCFLEFDKFLKTFECDLSTMNLTQKEVNYVYSICKKLIQSTEALLTNLLKSSSSEAAVPEGFSFILNRLCARDSTYKRQKLLEKTQQYVRPQEKAIGTKWKTIPNSVKSIPDFKLMQSRFQFVPISDTLRSLFKNELFKQMYIEYNSNKLHECTDGIYHDFCCGEIFKKHDVLKDPLTIQIQLGIDDFDPGDALKSLAGNQKMCGVYFEIRNIHPHFSSKLNTRNLVALAKATDLKANDSRNIISQCIVKDLASLETVGLELNSDVYLKGVLVNICFDNLGGNSILGLCESFNSEYYCRICECCKAECRKNTSENLVMLRSSTKYAQFAKDFQVNEPDLKQTKGMKRCCPFNDLKYFHGFENFSVDIMHDLLEGVVPFCIKIFFESLKAKDVNFNVIQSLLRDFNYGFLSKAYKPSKIRIESNSLGQSARQLHCLFLHMPFIFANYKDIISHEWSAMIDLISVVRIAFSNRITTDDLNHLNNAANRHLRFVISTGRHLLPKHHMITHYAEVIRRMGPLIKMWMMRYESKHKVFTDMAHRTQNFINLPKTLAFKHQMKQSFMDETYLDKMEESKTKYNITKAKNYDYYKNNLNSLNIECTEALNFLVHNSNEYRPGLMIILDCECFEIIHVLSKEGVYNLYCHPYEIVCYDPIFNAIEVKKRKDSDGNKLISLDRLKIEKTFDRVLCQNKFYVICETLDAFGAFL